MHNFKRGHRATSIGTQLLTNYRKYLVGYERAWGDVDLAKYAGQRFFQVLACRIVKTCLRAILHDAAVFIYLFAFADDDAEKRDCQAAITMLQADFQSYCALK